LFDERALYLEISLGRRRVGRLKCRIDGQREAALFGVYPDVTLKNARERRDTHAS
jgi:hypothetical protein